VRRGLVSGEHCVDLFRERGDLFGRLFALPRKFGVGLEKLKHLLRLVFAAVSSRRAVRNLGSDRRVRL
jgi:hypothetical protein